jgi:serine/threonine protein kinase
MTQMGGNADPLGWVGSMIGGRYRVERLVGEGGYGVVYLAHDLRFNSARAIKCLRPDRLATARRPWLVDQLRAEGRLLDRLSGHPAIVRVYDIDEATSPNGVWTPYLVLEWVEGHTLRREIEDRAGHGNRHLAPEEALDLLEPAFSALALAHKTGIVHLDIKPDNLMVTQAGAHKTVTVLDFGVAKIVRDATGTGAERDTTGELRRPFTGSYAAPEQHDSRYGKTRAQTDVFSLALVFVEVVAGRRALDSSSDLRLLQDVFNEERRPTLRELGYPASDELERVLRRALDVHPGNRYDDAGSFLEALRRAVGGPRSREPRAPTSEPLPTASDRRGGPRRARRGGSTRAWLAWTAAPLLLASVGTATWLALSPNGSGSGSPAPATPMTRSPPTGTATGGASPATCAAPCCGGVACSVAAENSGDGGHPSMCRAGEAQCRACPSGMPCIPGACSLELPHGEKWALRLSWVGVKTEDAGLQSICDSPYAGAVVCFRPGLGPRTCIATDEACARDGEAPTPVPVTTEDVVGHHLLVEVLDGARRTVLAQASAGGVPAAQKYLCEGYRIGVTPTPAGRGITTVAIFLDPPP